jgi:hypothetical protein
MVGRKAMGPASHSYLALSATAVSFRGRSRLLLGTRSMAGSRVVTSLVMLAVEASAAMLVVVVGDCLKEAWLRPLGVMTRAGAWLVSAREVSAVSVPLALPVGGRGQAA